MREYYLRFFREVWGQFRLFGKAQIYVGLLATIGQIIREGQIGAIGRQSIWPSVLAALAGYIAVCLLKLSWILITTPPKLDEKRTSEIFQRDALLEQGKTEITSLQAKLDRKHPHDEHKDELVRVAIAKLDDRERECLRWMLTMEQAGGPELHHGGFQGVPHSIISKTGATQLLKSTPERAMGGVRTEQHFSINPALGPAIREFFYP